MTLRTAGWSIRRKLLAVVMATASLALLIAGGSLVFYDARIYRRQSMHDLATQAEVLGAISSAALAFDDAKAATEYLATLRARAIVRGAAIYGPGGGRFATFLAEGAPDRMPAKAPAPGVWQEGDELVLAHAIAEQGESLGTVVLRASLGTRDRLLRFAGVVLVLSALAFGLALAISRKLQALLVDPLMEVADVARAIVRNQDYAARARRRSEDEVGLLVEAFNDMLDQIQARERKLSDINAALALEVEEHKVARAEVATLNATLERRVEARTRDLESLNRELESFSYSVSHDLRAPLRSIDGFTSLLQRNHADHLDEQGRAYMERVRAATQRMGHLIDDLLQLSRTARSELAPQEMDLSAMAESVLHDLRQSAPNRDVETFVQPGVRVRADAILMRTVLENLLGNAWKFTLKRDAARIEFGADRAPERTVCFVRDNGAGFDMRYVDKLFGPFQRLHSSVEFEGTGVGLANVQRIIRRHGGDVWCQGALGAGATFYFALPT